MTLDRDTFRKVDRKLASELDQKEGSRLLRIPVSDATWSAWQRYCQALRIPMGRAASLLIENELRALVGEGRDPVTIAEVEGEVARRRAAIEERERRVDERERTIARRSAPLSSNDTRVERNDRCPCGSGLSTSAATGCGPVLSEWGHKIGELISLSPSSSPALLVAWERFWHEEESSKAGSSALTWAKASVGVEGTV